MPPQREADVTAARLAAESAWQQAAHAAQQAAAQQQYGHQGSAAGYGPPWTHSGWQPHPGDALMFDTAFSSCTQLGDRCMPFVGCSRGRIAKA